MKADSREIRFCEKEEAVLAALRLGALSGDLLAHVGVCEACTEASHLSNALLQEIAIPTAELRLPDAGSVWRRAEAMAKQQAIAKATRPIRIARICACAAAVIALPWVASTFMNSIPTFTHQVGTVDRILSQATGTTLLGAGASLILISLSSWYVLRQQ